MILATIRQDIQYALRLLRQSPVFAAVAVGSLALGIGANTAIFTLIDAILLRWLPVQNPQQLVMLARNPANKSTSFNYPDYRYIRDHAKSYSGVMAFAGTRPVSFRMPEGTASQLVATSLVSGNYFEVLGVQPALGRVFNAADNVNDGAHPQAVLSYDFWKRALGENTAVIGRDVILNGYRFQVVGVSREGFKGASVGSSPDVFVPIVMYRTFQPTAIRWNTRHMWWLTTMGRLKPGVSPAEAEAEYAVLWKQILDNDPERGPVATWNKDYAMRNKVVILPGSQGQSYLRGLAEKPLTILMLTVGLVLLIACANVANLLLARGLARGREIAVRLAIGAGRSRLITQMLIESVTLSFLGGLAGLAFAWLGVRALVSFLPRGTFAVDLNISPDLRLLSFAFALSIFSGLLFGLIPALQSSRPDVVTALKSDSGSIIQGRGRRWDLRRTLVSVQVALSLLLLAGSGLFVRSLSNLKNIDPGMNRENMLMVDTNISQLGYQPQRTRQFHERLRDFVQRAAGVKTASLAEVTPLGGSQWNGTVKLEGYTWKPDEQPAIDMNAVAPRYFEAAGIPIVLGRDFQTSDQLAALPNRPDPPLPPGTDPPDPGGPARAVIVNEALARRFFGGQQAIGKRLCTSDKWDSAKTWEIVGVVGNARYFDIRKPVEPMIYFPMSRDPRSNGGGTLVVRTTGDPKRLIEIVRRQVTEIDSAVAVTESKTMDENLNRNLVQERFVATFGGFFGVVALLLAAIGLYGVMSQAVDRRTREIGIRMALGAEARKVLWMVLRDAMLMVFIGAAAGIPTVLFLTRYAQTLLYGVNPQDPVTLGAAGLILVSVTALAAFLPAVRATRVQPLRALRHD